MHPRLLLEETFLAALSAVSPAVLLAPYLNPDERPDFILAFGKASLPMARAALKAYPGVPTLIVPPVGTADLTAPPEATVMVGSHPVPDERSLAAAEALKRLSTLRADQEALILVSGGGSALLCAPDGVTLAQKQALTRDLLRAGADIAEINTVRRHLSRTKGGRLAQVSPARLRALLLSDVVGDDMSVIASGPTVADPTTFADALAVLDHYGLRAPEARNHFLSGVPDTPQSLPNVTNQIIGSNRVLLEAAQRYLSAQGIRAVILGDTFEGEARELPRFHAAVARSVRHSGSPVTAPVILLSGGEATVTLRGDGTGGRNQEFALALLLALGEEGLYALSAGSDGIDGSSEAAGAFLRPDSLGRAHRLELDPAAHLARNDSGTFFAALSDAVVTGPTGHNLNDFRAIFIPAGDLD